MITYIEFDVDHRVMLVDADVDELVVQAGYMVTVERHPAHQVIRLIEFPEVPSTTFFSLTFRG